MLSKQRNTCINKFNNKLSKTTIWKAVYKKHKFADLVKNVATLGKLTIVSFYLQFFSAFYYFWIQSATFSERIYV